MRLTAQLSHKNCILYDQITVRLDVDVGKIRAVDRPKTSTASKATLSICLKTKLVASSPICKSSVVDLVDLVMSKDHRNNNGLGQSRQKKKKKVKQRKVRSRAHLNQRPFTLKLAVYHLGYLRIDKCEREKNPVNHVGYRHGVLDSRSGKEGVVMARNDRTCILRPGRPKTAKSTAYHHWLAPSGRTFAKTKMSKR